MYADKPEQMKEWVVALNASLNKNKSGPSTSAPTPAPVAATPDRGHDDKKQEILEPTTDILLIRCLYEIQRGKIPVNQIVLDILSQYCSSR
jgi:hypothetical protein